MDAATIFAEALNKSDDTSRARFLDEICDRNAVLRAEVDELLQAHAEAGDFLQPAMNAAMARTDVLPSVTEKAGDRIGPYKLLQQIGEGGFGVVYMAQQTEPVRRKVALKVIKPGMDTKEVVARFEAERQALALMDHPNIATVLDGGSTDTGRPYFVMELVKGTPITKFCDQNNLDAHSRLRLFTAVCRAIQHAHQKGVIHRDVKPSNVLVTLHDGEPVPKVIDFGVAKAISQQLTEKTMFTAFGQMIGTPQYMSPEQAEMSGLDVDTRSDIYSLGVLLYELLTGSTPLDPRKLRETAFAELQRMIREDEPPRPSVRLTSQREQSVSIAARRRTAPDRLEALVRGDLDWIVMKSLEKNREQRYESPNALAADVERFLNQEAVTACPPSFRYRFRKFAKRNKAVIATTFAIAGSLVLGLSVAIWLAVVAMHDRDRAMEAEQLAHGRLQRAEDAEENAMNEAERAEVILEFLEDSVFSRATPFTLQDVDLSLRTILQQIPMDESQWSTRSPLAEASIRHYLGVTCSDIGLYHEAHGHLQRALKLRRAHLGDDDIDTARTSLRLAGLEISFVNTPGKLTAAESHALRADLLCTAAVETMTRKLGKEDVESLQAACLLAMISHFRGDQDRALSIYRELEEYLPGSSARNIHDPHDLLRSIQLIIQRKNVGRMPEVNRLIEKNYADVCRDLPDHHPHRLFWTTWRGIMLMQQDRLGEADVLLTDAREKRIGILHPKNTFIWLGNRTLAGLRVRQNRRDEAIELLRFGRLARPEEKSTALGLGALLLDRSDAESRSEWLDLSTEMLGYHKNTDHPETAYQVALLTLATPHQSAAERDMQQQGITLAREMGKRANQQPPGILLFPELMRPSIMLAHAIAEYRAGDVETSLGLFSDVEQESSMMCRAISLAYRAAIERRRGNQQRVKELIDQAHKAAASAPPEELDDTGQHLWNRRILLELAIRETETEIDPIGSNTVDQPAGEGEPDTSASEPMIDHAGESTKFWKGELSGEFLPLAAAPKQHKVVFENQYVRVFRVINPPGGVAPPHVHIWPSVVIVDEPADLVSRNEDGTVRRQMREEEMPGVMFNEPSVSPYSIQNVDDHPIQLWRLEMKQLPKPSPEAPTTK